MQSERDLVGMRCTPGDNALQLDRIVGDGTYFHQLGFDDFRGSHRNLEWHSDLRTSSARRREWPPSRVPHDDPPRSVFSAFTTDYAENCKLDALFSLNIASSSGSVSLLSFCSGCFGAGRLAIRKSRKCFVAARRA
jgi:hypothetical protein